MRRSSQWNLFVDNRWQMHRNSNSGKETKINAKTERKIKRTLISKNKVRFVQDASWDCELAVQVLLLLMQEPTTTTAPARKHCLIIISLYPTCKMAYNVLPPFTILSAGDGLRPSLGLGRKRRRERKENRKVHSTSNNKHNNLQAIIQFIALSTLRSKLAHTDYVGGRHSNC